MSSPVSSVLEIRSLAAVIATATIIGIGNSILPPLLSIRLEAVGISTAWSGLLAAMPAVAILATGATFPSLLKRFGALVSFYGCTAVAIVCLLLFPLTDNYWLWVVLRLVMGAWAPMGDQ